MTSRTEDEWEERFRAWAGGPGDIELERCDNTERMIKKAIAASMSLKSLNIEVFAQGSFRNITNIAQESDVDVCVCLQDAMYYQIPEGTEASDFFISPTAYNYDTYKQNVINALNDYFGEDKITLGDKAIRIHSTSYRVDADVIPSWEFREYYDVNRPFEYRSGVRFYSDHGKEITNYPKQHIDCGIEKNRQTQKRFKRMARILKTLQIEMIDRNFLNKKLPSFLIESLVYNVPDDHFGASSYRSDVRMILAYLFNNTIPQVDCTGWTEVNGIKILFHFTQPWSKEDAHAFVDTAWDYIGYE